MSATDLEKIEDENLKEIERLRRAGNKQDDKIYKQDCDRSSTQLDLGTCQCGSQELSPFIYLVHTNNVRQFLLRSIDSENRLSLNVVFEPNCPTSCIH